MKKNGKLYQKLYRKLFVSYIVILLFPVVTGTLFYSYAYNYAKKTTDESNQRIVQMIKKSCDKELGTYLNSLLQLAFNKDIQVLSAAGETFEDSEYYNLYELYLEMEGLKGTFNLYNTYCEDVFAYFPNSGTIVSSEGNMPFSLYYELYVKNKTMNEEEMKTYFYKSHFYDVIRIEPQDETQDPYFLITMNGMRGYLGMQSSLIGVQMNIKALNDVIDSLKWEGGDVLILNEDNQVMNRSKEETEKYHLEEFSEDMNTLDVKGEKFIVCVEKSEYLDWKYVSLIPEKVISSPTSRIRNVFMIGSVFCLFIGFVVSWQMTRLNYNPLESLLDLISIHKSRDEDEDTYNNEYLYLRKKTKDLIQEHTDFRHMLANNQKIIHQYYLTRLLETSYDEKNVLTEKDKTLEKFQKSSNMVLLLKAENQDTKQTGKEDAENTEKGKRDSLKKFIIENIFREQAGVHFDLEIVDVGEMLAVILPLSNEKEGKEILLEVTENVQNFIQTNFSFRVIALAGNSHDGFDGIHLSYMEARQMEEFIQQLETDYISYEDVKTLSDQGYYYPINIESKILSALQSGNEDAVNTYVRNIFDVNYKQNRIPPLMMRCLVYDVMGTLLKGISENGSISRIEEYADLKLLSVKMPYVQLLRYFENIIHVICEENSQNVEENNEQETGNQLSLKVMEYIQNNYQNPDLNISQTGLYFHMTPAYLSMLFKKQTGESLLKYISQVRVDAAKTLLEEGKNVTEVAEMVGFRDSSTFIRVFKKTTGMTPGQIRQR